MTCTHATCTTAFCPHCGEGVGNPVSWQLLTHIRAQVGTLNSRVRERTEEAAGPDQAGLRVRNAKKYLANSERVLAKWTAWESWVAAHIAKDAEGEA